MKLLLFSLLVVGFCQPTPPPMFVLANGYMKGQVMANSIKTVDYLGNVLDFLPNLTQTFNMFGMNALDVSNGILLLSGYEYNSSSWGVLATIDIATGQTLKVWKSAMCYLTTLAFDSPTRTFAANV